MITENAYWSTLRLLAWFVVAFAVKKAWAAGPEIPIVYILATDPCAAETGLESSTFTVFRTGPTNEALTVHYRVSGSASNGVDYVALSGTVAIQLCASSAPIAVRADGKNSHC
jgi:hypothetical protein